MLALSLLGGVGYTPTSDGNSFEAVFFGEGDGDSLDEASVVLLRSAVPRDCMFLSRASLGEAFGRSLCIVHGHDFLGLGLF